MPIRNNIARLLASAWCVAWVLALSPLFAQGTNRLPHAISVAQVEDTNYSGVGWSWLSSKEILTDRKSTSDKTELICVNIATHTVSILSRATRLFQRLAYPVPHAMLTNREARVSSDGHWLLLSNFFYGASGSNLPDDTDPIRSTAIAMSLDGKQQITFRMTEAGSSIAWLPDSQHWIEVTHYPPHKIITHALKHPQQTTSALLILSPPANEYTVVGVTAHNVMILASEVPAPRGQGTWLVYYTLDLKSTPLDVHSFTFEKPGGVTIWQAAPSPDGRRIAWLWWVEDKETYRSYLQRQGVKEDNLVEWGDQVWVSTLQGTQWHNVELAPQKGVENLFWKPDGKRLFYSSKTDLWSLPLPGRLQ